MDLDILDGDVLRGDEVVASILEVDIVVDRVVLGGASHLGVGGAVLLGLVGILGGLEKHLLGELVAVLVLLGVEEDVVVRE